MNVLVFDLGTTNFKASVFNETGSLLATTRLPTPIESNVPGRCEISPDAFRQTIAKLLQQLNQESPDITDHIDAITFATQTNSFILLDGNGDPLTQIVLWSDDRALDDENAFTSRLNLSDFRTTTGVPFLSHQFMIAKLAWLRIHEPGIVEKTVRLCLISDYLTLWLTGQHVTEAGTAGLTGLLNIHTRRWWLEGCVLFDVPLEWLPRVVQASTDLGTISSETAHALGLSESCRFIAGCLDQYAGAIGVGNVVSGGVSETTGTVLATVKCADSIEVHISDEVFQGPSFCLGKFFQMTFGSTSANLLEEYRATLADKPSFAELDDNAAEIPAGAEGQSRGHAVRKIMETVSYALHDQVSALCPDTPPDRILCAGGAARSTLWLQIKADVLNCTMINAQCPEPTSLGAAVLALHAHSGKSVGEITEECVRPNPPINPDDDRHQLYRRVMAGENYGERT